MRGLNLGCGRRFHPKWENVDFVAAAPGVRAHDLRQGIPYPDESFDAVYHSHLLEHFPKQAAPEFLRECRRVLKAGGVLRVAVPDLEKIARGYLEALENARGSIDGADENYDWMMLELYDQTVRERSGGACYDYLRRDAIPNWDFIYSRVGAEAEAARSEARAATTAGSKEPGALDKTGYVLRNFGAVLRGKLAKAALRPEDLQSLEAGRFRRRGEIHQWMYDSYSLARALKEAGFATPRQCSPTQSAIPDWAGYCLDTEADGRTYKPDSLYMEAARP